MGGGAGWVLGFTKLMLNLTQDEVEVELGHFRPNTKHKLLGQLVYFFIHLFADYLQVLRNLA